ncbi:MAG TPA: hypothetical protein VF054_06715 [Micromonosporaceae bacterium]
MSVRSGVPTPLRLPVLACAGLALLGGLYAALLLLGLPVPAPRPDLAAVHGPVMVLGFVGTLIALERAVALGARWALVAPSAAGLGALVLLGTGPTVAGKLLLAVGGVGLLGVYAALWRRQPSVALLAQAAGAFAWYAAALLWLGGFTVAETLPWLAGFVVLTIAGERLELAHLSMPAHAERRFVAVLVALVVGATAATLWPKPGHQVLGLALLATVAWLAGYDVARRTVRGRGLPRFVAVGLLAGYGWLALAGLLWAGTGPSSAGPRYDAVLHAIFLGFVISMIFVHAPVIMPAVLRRPLPYHPVLYAPLLLLHASLLTRLALGDLAGLTVVWQWSAIANEAALLGFVGCAAALALRGRTRPRPAAAPQAVTVA